MTATVEKSAPALKQPDTPKAKDPNPGMPASLRAKAGAITINPDAPVSAVVDQFVEWLQASGQRARFLALTPDAGRPPSHQAIPGFNPIHQRLVRIEFVIPR